MTDPTKESPPFDPGCFVVTSAVTALFSPIEIDALLKRHCSGDWGDLGDSDQLQNDLSLDRGSGRLFSRYEREENGCIVYVITEAERLVTTIFLSSEY